jgi:methyltransferase (TIGR00027 family)
MMQNSPSKTAYRVALSRAAHQMLDMPKVLEDPVALRLVGAKGAAEIRGGGRQFTSKFAHSLRAFLVARSRFAEDELASAIARGVRQYVILGAGLDTFAYRHPYAAIPLRVFEVDHPNTQAFKRTQLDAAGIAAPSQVTFVPMNFETQTLAEQLRLAGFNADEPTFFSWLGVSMYLKPETVMATMQYVASSSAIGSSIVFDFITPISRERLFRRLHLRALTYLLAAIGEPWHSFFDPLTLRDKLKTMGFTQVDGMGPDDINTRYFHQRTDKLKVGGLGHVMLARV